ncbi:uncharacterized protein LOC108673860 [Hyalella azteca]|uniref:Uncharacterized protein LOC108673860 n=1 Tax=Hyalella azteca TaxID=294128 RepID=A0A8B7NU21_HYAAZ|nr:uncharacterized protein LOC108673860 [Hyalella azteca]
MKSVRLVLLIATFAYSGVDGYRPKSACGKALYYNLTSNSQVKAVKTCASDPLADAAVKAIASYGCAKYAFQEGPLKCEVGAAPFMKCLAGKLGYLKADGSIDNMKILAQYRRDATRDPACNAARYNFAENKCGTTIDNYAFLAKMACLAAAADQYLG